MPREYFNSLTRTSGLRHCPFCKPPSLNEKNDPIESALEAKTKLLLMHEEGQLKVLNTHVEPGEPRRVESNPCVREMPPRPLCPRCSASKNEICNLRKICRCSFREIPMMPAVLN